MANIVQPINLGPNDLALSINQALPAAGANALSGVFDLQSVAPNGDAWRLGRFEVTFPALPESADVTKSITISLLAAPPSLTAGISQAAPNNVVPGAFVTPLVSQTLTLPGVANGGSLATIGYFTAAFDANGSPYQFYQFLVTTAAGIITQGELVQIAWVYA